MKSIASVAILLWVVTVMVFAWFFIKGNTTQSGDGRTAIMLQANERDLILSEMRGLLSATQGILDGANRGDMQSVVNASIKAGTQGAADVNPMLMAKLPIEVKTLGMSVHHDMDDIAKAAASGKPAAEITKMTAQMMSKCVACHAAWQIKSTN